MSGQLEGRVAIVTGAGGGLGRGISLAFAREGAAIVVADRDDEKGAETLRALCGLGARAAYLHVDVTNPELVRASSTRPSANSGRFTCLSTTRASTRRQPSPRCRSSVARDD